MSIEKHIKHSRACRKMKVIPEKRHVIICTCGADADTQELLDLCAKADKVPALEARLAKAEDLLRRLEWEGNWHPNYYTCPICACSRDDGRHADECELDAFLKGASK